MAPTWEVNRSADAEVPPGELLTVATLNFRVVYGEVPSDDETESPLLVGSDDSTHRSGQDPACARRPIAHPRHRAPRLHGPVRVDPMEFQSSGTRNGKWAALPRTRNPRTEKT